MPPWFTVKMWYHEAGEGRKAVTGRENGKSKGIKTEKSETSSETLGLLQ